MAYLEYGLNEGLAYKHDFQQDIQNLHQSEMLDRQARVDAESKAQLLGDKFKFGKAYDTYNNARLKTFTEDKIKEIGRFTDQNRDFMTNPMGWATFNKLTNDLVDNPIVQESARAKMNLDEMLKFQQAHPEMANSPRMRAQIDAYHNYATTASAEPTSSVPHEFMFVPPAPYKDLNSEAVKYGNGIKDFEPIQLDAYQHGLGAWESQPKPEALRATVNAMYQDNQQQIDEQYKQAGYSSPQEYCLAMLLPSIPKQYHKGDFASLIKLESDKAKNKDATSAKSPYEVGVKNLYTGELPEKFSENAFGVTPPVFSITGSGPADKQQWTGKEVKWNNQFSTGMLEGKKTKFAMGTIRLSRAEAVERNIAEGWFGEGLRDPGVEDMKGPWKSKGLATMSRDDKNNWVVDVNVVHPFDDSLPIYKEMYDKVVPTKYRTSPGVNGTVTVVAKGTNPANNKPYTVVREDGSGRTHAIDDETQEVLESKEE